MRRVLDRDFGIGGTGIQGGKKQWSKGVMTTSKRKMKHRRGVSEGNVEGWEGSEIASKQCWDVEVGAEMS